MRFRLVDAAARLLSEEGPSAVQARRVAQEIGASTMAVYHHLGGMPELLRAVADEGFARLGTRMAAVPAGADPIADACTLALAYRRAARENKHLYDLMFGLSTPGGHRPSVAGASVVADNTAAQAAYAPLVDAVRRAMSAGRLRDADPAVVAAQFWCVVHGYVTLELAGQFSHVADPVVHVLVPMGVNLLVGLGDSPERASASAAEAVRTGA